MKTCARCLKEQPLSNFQKAKNRPSGVRPWCRSCTSADNNSRRAASPEKHRAIERKSWADNFHKNGEKKAGRSREWKLRNVFGLTLAEFAAMLERQHNECAICHDALLPYVRGRGKKGIACVDHDHATGAVRAILCNACNTGLGKFRDNAALLERAATYLRGHKK